MKINLMVWETYGWIAGTRSFIEEIQTAIPAISQRGIDRLDEMAKTLSWDYERYTEERQEIESTVEHWLPLTLKYSAIALSYMIAETRLNALAKAIERRPDINIKYTNIKGKGINKSRLFIKKSIRYDLSSDSAWEDLCHLATLRHLILHNLGRQGKYMENVKIMLKRYKGEISLSGQRQSGDSTIIIEYTLCHRFLNILDGFFRRIYDACGFSNKIVTTVH
jgi:hypothetical protein